MSNNTQDARTAPDPQDAQVSNQQQAARKPNWWAPALFQVFLLVAWAEALSNTGTSRDLHIVGVTVMQVLWVGWVAEVYRRRRGGGKRYGGKRYG